MKTRAELKYQARQTPRGIDLTVVTAGAPGTAHLARDVARSLAEARVPDPPVTVRRVATIERDRRTGKARRFIPL